jgi:hypothetical protein
MANVFEWFKKNRIKISKILITIIVVYFLFCSLMQLLFDFTRNYFQTLTLIYIVLLIICNLLSEFSPYVLHNYLLRVFPFLSNYLGRGIVYILIGILYLSPELSKSMNTAGYATIFIGFVCFWLNWLIARNVQIDYQDFVVMKDNYQDFGDSQRESLAFPMSNIISNNNNNNINSNSSNNNYIYN